ncbi:hypothetical protein SCHPADRAFT_538819 [Schizopora paradoxa]|uniref:Uncharacterized protein n=1 Tax=Schizopora paradoxa TaxID=27342 RepID=A0A0H2RDU8_9AGAM|nr:hypothetical protein SCHPADRAFT_538819 [Schizopora paradoxa]
MIMGMARRCRRNLLGNRDDNDWIFVSSPMCSLLSILELIVFVVYYYKSCNFSSILDISYISYHRRTVSIEY